MPKKDTAATVLGMLSTVGAQTRVTAPVEESAPAPVPAAPAPTPNPAEPSASTMRTASVSTLAPAAAPATGEAAPRTIRLRSDTAAQLRAAWLEAKRDDVLLQAQDFASMLVEEALNRRRRSRTASSS
ncbi:MAG: hypothetical protein QOJ80_2785 [Mycobacterium sp.]|jgi:hypothetical protein|nr:hypothetical protein [Mycobacterium sp.]